MICRLCLIVTKNGRKILTDSDVKTEMANMILEYFEIEIQPEDAISNKICYSCWKKIQDFHSFCLDVKEKQKTLQINLEIIETKQSIEGHLTEEFHTALTNYEDGGLREPEIDLSLVLPESCENEFDAVGIYNDADDCITTDHESMPSSPVSRPKEQLKRSKTATSNAEKMPKRNYVRRTLRSKTAEDGVSHINEDGVGTRRLAKLALIAEMDKYIAENSELSCCLCKKSLKDFSDLRKHFRENHNCEGYMTCCNSRFLKRPLWVDHLKMHRDPSFLRCHICNKKLANRNTYQNHMDSKHPNSRDLQFLCKLCPRKFVKQYLLDYHMKSRHTTTRDFICKTCNKAFVSAGVLKKHERNIHLNAYESVCEICGKCFKAAHNLMRHVDAIHSESSRTRAQCHICNKWLKNAYSLKKHIIAHDKEPQGKEFPCSKCGSIKYSRQSLAAHIHYHHSDKRFKCPVCSKEFKMPIALREHEAKHAGIHLYSCSICAKKFRSIRNMRRHLTNHSKTPVHQQCGESKVPEHSSRTETRNMTQGYLSSLPLNQT